MKRNSLKVTVLLMIGVVLAATFSAPTAARRRINPVNTAATATQAINETANDTSRINAKRRAASISFVDDHGHLVYVDTVTGEEWIDSAAMQTPGRVPKMEYPLFHALNIGLNVWDPVMRAFGQKYGIADAWVELSLHNRYKPIVEVGLGTASDTPSGMNYTYRSPMSVYFRIGANYNFLYNSNPDYSFYAGLRYGFAPFSYSLENVTLDSPYWDETVNFNIPSQRVTAGWLEVALGLQVKLWGPISAGWSLRYKAKLHESKTTFGQPWYIPGYGTRNTNISGSFSIIYTLPLGHLNKPKPSAVLEEEGVSTLPPAVPADTLSTAADSIAITDFPEK